MHKEGPAGPRDTWTWGGQQSSTPSSAPDTEMTTTHPSQGKAGFRGAEWQAECCTMMGHSEGRTCAQAFSSHAHALHHSGSGELEKRIIRTWGKVTQEIFTPPHQFSQIPIKPNPTTRNNFSPRPDPQMLEE